MNDQSDSVAATSAEPEDQSPVDIHKPKPWHGFREFLKEYLIIVVGVLTALGGEQLVEEIHWNQKVHRAIERENSELERIYYLAYERAVVQGCIEARADRLKKALLAADGAWTPAPDMGSIAASGRGSVLVTPTRNWPDQGWKSLVADGTASHLGREQERLYAITISQVESLNARNDIEREQVASLNVLSNATVLSRSERNALVQKLEEEKIRSANMVLSARQVLDRMGQMMDVGRAKAQAQSAILGNSSTYRSCFEQGLLPPGSAPPRALSEADRRLLGMGPAATQGAR
ncbi:MAG TPA: hypothetical protein VFN88_14165 [Caulobacteraceae bacterium]|nr:hypothetical protein [Caulobacteraceae bacterium]